MDSMRLLQQRALRQIFQSRPQSRVQVRHLNIYSHPPPHQCGLRRQQTTLPIRQHHRRKPTSSTSSRPLRSTRFQSTSTTSSSSDPPLTLSQRMRKLSREYGYSALGVYLALTALDLPFCYLAVSYLGTERIGRWEHAVLSYVKGMVKWPMGEGAQETVDEASEYVKEKVAVEEVRGEKRLLDEEATYVDGNDHGYAEAEREDSGENASFWTKLALAYAIHKSFIFIRVPLTAAVTPKVVKTLRSWGWDIGKRSAAAAAKKRGVVKGTGVNTAKTGVGPEKK